MTPGLLRSLFGFVEYGGRCDHLHEAVKTPESLCANPCRSIHDDEVHLFCVFVTVSSYDFFEAFAFPLQSFHFAAFTVVHLRLEMCHAHGKCRGVCAVVGSDCPCRKSSGAVNGYASKSTTVTIVCSAFMLGLKIWKAIEGCLICWMVLSERAFSS